MMKTINKVLGALVGNLMCEKSIALWAGLGRPDLALILASAEMIERRAWR